MTCCAVCTMINKNSTFFADTHILHIVRVFTLENHLYSNVPDYSRGDSCVPRPWCRGIGQGDRRRPVKRSMHDHARARARRLFIDIDQPDGVVQAGERHHRRRVVPRNRLVQGCRLPQQSHAALVSRRTVLLRGRPRWLAVGRRWGRGRRLRVHLVGQ